jgi:hypothetical protein
MRRCGIPDKDGRRVTLLSHQSGTKLFGGVEDFLKSRLSSFKVQQYIVEGLPTKRRSKREKKQYLERSK